jgi:hypothetical protein
MNPVPAIFPASASDAAETSGASCFSSRRASGHARAVNTPLNFLRGVFEATFQKQVFKTGPVAGVIRCQSGGMSKPNLSHA